MDFTNDPKRMYLSVLSVKSVVKKLRFHALAANKELKRPMPRFKRIFSLKLAKRR
jgi:hypothetical protein